MSSSGRTRRGVLAGGAGVAAALAGCSGRETVEVLAAGSLQHSFEHRLREVTDARVALEAHGSAACARLVAEGRRDPDVLALADPALFDVAGVDWYAAFATNALAVAYTEATPGGRAVRDADQWFDPLLAGEAAVGRTDPDLDPLGYRTLFACSLAADHYGVSRLAALPESAPVYPETGLLAALETGGVDAAFVYRSMAAERGYPVHSLPAEVDLSDPDRAEHYRAESYTLPDGTTVRGGAVRYGITRLRDTGAARQVFDAVVSGRALSPAFERPDEYPRFVGDVPRR